MARRSDIRVTWARLARSALLRTGGSDNGGAGTITWRSGSCVSASGRSSARLPLFTGGCRAARDETFQFVSHNPQMSHLSGLEDTHVELVVVLVFVMVTTVDTDVGWEMWTVCPQMTKSVLVGKYVSMATGTSVTTLTG